MSTAQREMLDHMLREHPFDLGGEVGQQRAQFEALMTSLPLPADVRTTTSELGGVGVVDIRIEGAEPQGRLLYLHGGAYAIGSAVLAAGLASDLARRSGTSVLAVDYRLAPEHPYPAAVQDVVAVYRAVLERGDAPGRIALAGESAGGGLVMAALMVIRDEGLPLPAAAYLVSPWADLTTTGESMITKVDVDPSVTPAGLRTRSADYLAGHDGYDGYVSAVFADLTGLPPMLVQVGGHEVLLDDAVRLAARAAAGGVAVRLEVTPGVPHVFVAFAGVLDEADAALGEAARFLRAHLNRSSQESAATPSR